MLDVTFEQINETVQAIRTHTQLVPEVGIVCGSGLGGLAVLVEDPTIVAYEHIPNFPHSSVPGHAGRLVFGTMGGKKVVCMQGRVHGYEGVSATITSFPIRVMKALGVQVLLLTNAAGGLRSNFKVGDVMVIRDHISFPALSGAYNPLIGTGGEERFGQRFVPMSDAWDKALQNTMIAVAAHQNLQDKVHKVSGPEFETAAELNMLRLLGGDAVGMSTVPEVIVARQCGLRVMGFSLITNVGVTDCDGEPANHEEVLEAGRQGAAMLERLVLQLVESVLL